MSSQRSCPKCGKVNKIKNTYCIECGFQFEGKAFIEFQILENLKASLYGSLICISLFVAFMVLVSFVIVWSLGPSGFLSFLIIWPITIGGLVWASCYLKGLTKTRRFTITKDYIEIMIPHKPLFHIDWADFDSIEVNKRDSMAAIPTGDGIVLGPKFVYFNLIFRGKNVERSYEFESGKDFKVRSRKKITIALEQHSKDKGKDFTGYKRKDKKGAKKAAEV